MRRISVVLLVALLSTGCPAVALVTGVGLGAGTYAWIKGELKHTYPDTFDNVWNASLDALQAMEMPVVSQNRDQLKGTIMAKRADGSDVIVGIKSKSEKTTEVGVRVGPLGNRDASTRIHDIIQTRL